MSLGLASDLVLTLVLNNQLGRMRSAFAKERLTLSYSSAFFNIFHGAVIRGLSCSSPGQGMFLEARRIDIGFHLPSVLRGQILMKNFDLTQARIDPEKIVSDFEALRRVFNHLDQKIGFFETSYVAFNRLWLGEYAALDSKGYLSVLSGGLLVARGEVKLVHIPLLENLDATALDKEKLGQTFDCLADIEIKDDAFEIVRFEMSNDVLRCLGAGRMKDLSQAQAAIDFQLSLPHLMFDQMPVLNTSQLQTRGLGVLSLAWSGPLDKAELRGELQIRNAEMDIFENISVSHINGSFIYANQEATSSVIRFRLNQRPYEGRLKIRPSDEGIARIVSDVKSVPSLDQDTSISLNIDADWTKSHHFKGRLDGEWRYASKDLFHHLAVNFDGFEAGMDEDLFINARETRLAFDVSSIDHQKKLKEVFRRTFFLDHLLTIVRRQPQGFSLEPLKAGCYGGDLEGWLFVASTRGKPLSVKAEAHVRDVDLSALAERAPGESSLILGKLDGDMKLDTTHLKDALQGQFFVDNGLIEQNSLLNSVADFLGVYSLRRIGFDHLSVFFNGGRAEYSTKAELQSEELNGLLEAKIFNYETIDGYLSAVISTRLLNESRQFKRILTYIKHDQPSVVFPFKISSYLQSPRILWLKNEFKEKLQNLLPERNKRYLQKQINSVVEGMRTE